MTAGERNVLADQLMDLLRQQSGMSAGDQVATVAVLAGKVIAAAVPDNMMRSSASKGFLSTMNAQLTLESAGEHRATQPIGRFGMEDDE